MSWDNPMREGPFTLAKFAELEARLDAANRIIAEQNQGLAYGLAVLHRACALAESQSALIETLLAETERPVVLGH